MNDAHSESEVILRPALPEDAALAVPLMYSSGPAAFEFVFGHARCGGAQEFLRRAFVDGAGEFGHRCHVVAEVDGRVAGIGAGYSGAGALSNLAAAVRQIARHYGLAAPGIIARGLRAEGVIPPPPKDLYYIAHLGVEPELRGRGVGARISHHLMAQGAAAGYVRAGLDVSAVNPRAQALYERLGFTVTWERASRLRNAHGHVAAHRRMERAL